MIERWRAAGCLLDEIAKHSMSSWAKTIGGILMVNGFDDFLANCTNRTSANDPIRMRSAFWAPRNRESRCGLANGQASQSRKDSRERSFQRMNAIRTKDASGASELC